MKSDGKKQQQLCIHRRTNCPICAVPTSRAADTAKNQEKQQIEVLHRKITELVQKSPDKAAKILTDWVNRGAVPSKGSKKRVA